LAKSYILNVVSSNVVPSFTKASEGQASGAA